MFLAHPAAGYLLARALRPRLAWGLRSLPSQSAITWVALAFSVVPDLDLFYFYGLDARRHNHHSYWTHIPIYWVALFALLAMLVRRHPRRLALVITAAASVFVHLVLDTVVGGISWLYPYSDSLQTWVEIRPRHGWWVWNFILHWTFGFELIVIAAAAWVWSAAPRRRR